MVPLSTSGNEKTRFLREERVGTRLAHPDDEDRGSQFSQIVWVVPSRHTAPTRRAKVLEPSSMNGWTRPRSLGGGVQAEVRRHHVV